MAGSYPDANSRKIAYDEDGSVVWYVKDQPNTWDDVDSPGLAFLNAADKALLNDTIIPTSVPSGFTLTQNTNDGTIAMCVYFPEPRDIKGVFFWIIEGNTRDSNPHYIREVQYSTDTTNGIDGTWTTSIAALSNELGDILSSYNTTSHSNAYRSQIQAVNMLGARAVRWIAEGGTDIVAPAIEMVTFHCYGSIPLANSPDRLIVIDNDSGLEFDMPQDWGDVPRGVVLDKEIKLRNNSSTLTANTISLAFEALDGTSASWYTIKEAGGSFGSTLNYTGSIAAGADSNVITIRLTIPDTADISLQEARMQITVGSWT